MTHGGSIPPTDGTDSGPHSIVGMSIGMGTSMDITPGGMEWTELAKRKRRRPHKYVIPGMAQLAIQAPGILPTTSPQTPLNIIVNGAIPNVTLHQQATSGGIVTYQGHYEILSLMGSFFPPEPKGGNLQCTGGLSVSLACANGCVIGGTVAGLLLVASPITVSPN
ncbi:unnamed protein product [Sphagnum troendelagicum]|uniref:AT-hook motif nuclear-localized protein n=1 Tax=Sphagnum troendelagicum TaxID=128251 RepID=A0ABP0ULR9_9BRYO